MNDLATTYRSPRTEAALRYRDATAAFTKSAKAAEALARIREADAAFEAAPETNVDLMLGAGRLPDRASLNAAVAVASAAVKEARKSLAAEEHGIAGRLRRLAERIADEEIVEADPDDVAAIKAWHGRMFGRVAALRVAVAVEADLQALRAGIERRQSAARREADELLERAARAKSMAILNSPDIAVLVERVDVAEVLATAAFAETHPGASLEIKHGPDGRPSELSIRR